MTTEKKSLTRMKFDEIFDLLEIDPQDAARWFFAAGWNAALDEAAKRVEGMPFNRDTLDSFAIYFKALKDDEHP